MTVQKTIKTIPEHVVEVTTYVAFDGKTFTRKDDCEKYELRTKKYLQIVGHQVFRTSQKTCIWPEDHSATLFYLSSEEDYQYLKKHSAGGKFDQDDFATFGQGYYLLVVEDMGDGPDAYFLYNLAYYIYRLESEFDSWKEEIGRKIIQEAEVREELNSP